MKSAKRSVSRRYTVAAFESLEGRLLFQTSPTVTSIVADDQGQATITFSEALKPSTVNTNSVEIFTAPFNETDPTLSDHNKQGTTVTYDKATDQVIVTTIPDLHPAPVNYEVILKGSIITGNGDNNTSHLIGGGPGALGAAGTQFKFVTSIDPTKIVMFQTSLGNLSFQLQPKSSMPATIPNFIQYVNNGAYDGTFFHRLTNPSPSADGIGVIQAGGFDLSGNTVETIPTRSAIDLERGISNTIGTIAMARTSSPDTATDQFYFNYTDNSAALDEPAGSGAPTSGFAAFGTVTSAQGEQVLQALAGTTPVDMSKLTGSVNSSFYSGTSVSNLPVLNTGLTASEVDSNLAANLVFIIRAAMQDTVSAVAVPASAPATAAANIATSPSSGVVANINLDGTISSAGVSNLLNSQEQSVLNAGNVGLASLLALLNSSNSAIS